MMRSATLQCLPLPPVEFVQAWTRSADRLQSATQMRLGEGMQQRGRTNRPNRAVGRRGPEHKRELLKLSARSSGTPRGAWVLLNRSPRCDLVTAELYLCLDTHRDGNVSVVSCSSLHQKLPSDGLHSLQIHRVSSCPSECDVCSIFSQRRSSSRVGEARAADRQ